MCKKLLLICREPMAYYMPMKETVQNLLREYNVDVILHDVNDIPNLDGVDAVVGLNDFVLDKVAALNKIIGNDAMTSFKDTIVARDKLKVLECQKTLGYKIQEFNVNPYVLLENGYSLVKKNRLGTGGAEVEYITDTELELEISDSVYYEEKMDVTNVIALHGYCDRDKNVYIHCIDKEYRDNKNLPGMLYETYNFLNIDQNLIKQHTALVQKLNMKSTYFSAEYIVIDNTYYIMDLNPRITGSYTVLGRKLTGLNCYEREGFLNILGLKDSVEFHKDWNGKYFTIKAINTNDGIIKHVTLPVNKEDFILCNLPWEGKKISTNATVGSKTECFLLYIHDSPEDPGNIINQFEKELNIEVE